MMKQCDVIKRVGGLMFVALAMTACAVDGDATDEGAGVDEPIAEVELANGSRVMFFEPVPGALAIGQQTAIGVAPVDTMGRSPVDVYRSIAPGQPVPELLAAAQARSDEARRDQPAREVPARPASVAGGSSSVSATYFENNFCYTGGYFFINCRLGQNDTGVKIDLDETHYDIDEFTTSICVNSGKVLLRAYVESDQRLGVQVTAGNCITYHWTSGLFNADSMRVRTTILSDTANYFLTVKWNH